jgi:hypothetical protein
LEELARGPRRHLGIRHQDAQLPLEVVGDLGLLGGLDLGDQAVQAGSHGRVGDAVTACQRLE